MLTWLPSELYMFAQGDICQLEKKVGPCRDLVERFYFDSQLGTCQKFYFGSCDGMYTLYSINQVRVHYCIKKITKRSYN